MDRRTFTKLSSAVTFGLLFQSFELQAKNYLTIDQAKRILWNDADMTPVKVVLTESQMKTIQLSSKTRVRNNVVKTWKVGDQGWFIVDQVIGKHENIDMAVALSHDGKVKGVEVLVYRETYGHQIRNEKWRAQFKGKDHSEVLKLDEQIKNISGATLSCRHITDGINRLTHTWVQVLRTL